MLKLIQLSTLIIFILMIMVLIINLSALKATLDREKNSPFECGFDPKNLARLPFSLQFFLIAIIFVIFDVELTLLLPLTLIMKMSSIFYLSLSFNIFSLILLFGLFHEQAQGSLNWVI